MKLFLQVTSMRHVGNAMMMVDGCRVWSVKDKSHLLTLAREEGALPTSIAWLTGEGNQVTLLSK